MVGASITMGLEVVGIGQSWELLLKQEIWHFEKNDFRFVKIHFIDKYVLSDIFCLHMFKSKI